MRNRLAREKIAIVHDEPGITRDRHYADTSAFGRPYTLIDTGGFDPEDEDPMKAGIAKHVSWSVLPLVAGLFVLVEALDRAGAMGDVTAALEWCAHLPRIPGSLAASFGITAVSNIMNNLPSGLLAGGAVQEAARSGRAVAPHVRDAVLVGVDLGPNLSVTGSLATILGLIALRREKIEVTAWRFLTIGALVMPPALLAALAAAGAGFRAVAVVAPTITRPEIEALHHAGVRGVRLNIVDRREGRNVVPLEIVHALANRIAPFGWHLEFLVNLDEAPDFAGAVATLPVPIVLGHLGYPRAGARAFAASPAFASFLRLLAGGRCWVKLTGPYRISRTRSRGTELVLEPNPRWDPDTDPVHQRPVEEIRIHGRSTDTDQPDFAWSFGTVAWPAAADVPAPGWGFGHYLVANLRRDATGPASRLGGARP